MTATRIAHGHAAPFVHGEVVRRHSTTATVAEVAARHSIRSVLLASYRAASIAGCSLNEASLAGRLLAIHESARDALRAAPKSHAWSDVQVRTYLRLVVMEEEPVR